MSEFERGNDPDKDSESLSFNFSDLSAETTGPLDQEFVAPDVSGTEEKWWKRKPNGESTAKNKRDKKSRSVPAMPRGGLKPALANMYSGIGMAIMPFDPSCGRVILENAESCAESLDELAKTNPAVRRALISLVTTSAWGTVIMAHAPILMAIAMHHVPALRKKQEQMIGEMAEMFANGFPSPDTGDGK